jgi:hypothetical protein
VTELSVRAAFGADATSLERVRAAVRMPRPVAVARLAQEYGADVVFDEAIITPAGVALDGRHKVTLERSGAYRYEGGVRATGFPSYEVSLVATIGIPLAGDDGTPGNAQVAVGTHGEVHGTNEPGSRTHRWQETGTLPFLTDDWLGVRDARFTTRLEYDTDWFGAAGGLASVLGQVVAFGATFGTAGIGVVFAGELASALDLEEAMLPGIVGIAVAGGAAFVLGPGVLIPAFVVGAATTAATVEQRALRADEIAFAEQIFGSTLPIGDILLTNLLGFGGRPFASHLPGGAVLLNIGAGFEQPLTYRGKGGPELEMVDGTSGPYRAPGQLLVHELTHAWQARHEPFAPGFYCRAYATALRSVFEDGVYRYGPATAEWSSFGTEQQAAIVDQWYAGNNFPPRFADGRRRRPRGNQTKYPPMHHDDVNPYYRFIRDHIRAKVS